MKSLPHPKAHSEPAAQPSHQFRLLGLRVAGAGLLAATGAIHLELYLTG